VAIDIYQYATVIVVGVREDGGDKISLALEKAATEAAAVAADAELPRLLGEEHGCCWKRCM